MKIKIKKVQGPEHGEITLPRYMTPGAAGMDVFAANRDPVTILPMGRALIPTGVSVELPDGFEAQMRPRSGLALKKGLTLPNSPGTIDPDYRGEIKIIVANIGAEPVTIACGDRIAQMIISRFERADWEESVELSDTGRSTGGFGHTGA
jgi:dUTP pyrophosphatase